MATGLGGVHPRAGGGARRDHPAGIPRQRRAPLSRRRALRLGAGLATAGVAAGAAAAASAAAVARLGVGWEPAVGWAVGPPEDHGLDGAAVERLRARLAARGTRAFLVARGETVVAEWYRFEALRLHKDPVARRHPTASIVKAAFTTTALLVCQGDGLLDLDDRAAAHLPPGWAADPARAGVTLRQLAEHSSGLDNARHAEWVAEPTRAWEDRYWAEPEARTALSLSGAVPLRSPPGREVFYSNPGYSVLAAVLARVLAATPCGDYAGLLRRRVMEPLGIPPRAWSLGGERGFEWEGRRVHEVGGGARASARALARIGRLYAAGGTWGGRTVVDPWAMADGMRAADARLLPAGWRERRQPAPALGWWSNAHGAWRSAPADTLVGAGAGHKVVVVVPSLDLVAVRIGTALGRSQFQGDYWAVLEDEILAPLAAAVVRA